MDISYPLIIDESKSPFDNIVLIDSAHLIHILSKGHWEEPGEEPGIEYNLKGVLLKS